MASPATIIGDKLILTPPSAALPERSRIISTTHGVATLKIEVKLPDGTVKMFFKKVDGPMIKTNRIKII